MKYLCDICLLRNRATLERNIHVKSRKAEWAECLKRDTIIMIIAILTKHFMTYFNPRRHAHKKRKSFLFFFGCLDEIGFIYLTLPYWANDRMLADKPWKELVYCITCVVHQHAACAVRLISSILVFYCFRFIYLVYCSGLYQCELV